ncbi:DUF2254 domain-containing protein [Myxococcus sp. CA039A]|uniref:DUF2254 domain-containing protein n=1 Tax=Myxococcus sp. CA039A TaxID=2741737 RepID=UPI00157AA464|nr:DUF2254 domain-containing protein [Myxococcus sp. CA039A]NTX50254.1 DUF2254 domain-containing protein [Myxococcus sp. CA039A]
MVGARTFGHGLERLPAPRLVAAHDFHRSRWWLRQSLWWMPIVGALLGGLMGVVLVRPPSGLSPVLRGVAWDASVVEARTMLSTVLGIVLTSLSVVLSLSMIVVQNAAAQYSPRLLRMYLRGPGIRFIIPIFISTSIFCLVATEMLGFTPTDGRYPRPALGMAMVLLILCEAALVFHVLNTFQLMRVENIVRQIRQDALDGARALARRRRHDVEPPQPARTSSQDTVVFRAHGQGFVVDVDGASLLSWAEARGLEVHVDVAIGEPVTRGAVLGRVAPGRPEVFPHLEKAILLGRWREQGSDVALCMRQLVDMAVKALSPAVNDPYTALEVVDQLTFLLCALEPMRLGPRVLADSSGRPRVFLRAATFRDYLSLATRQILRYGAGEPMVVLRLQRLAGEVGQRATTEETRQAVRDALHLIQAEAERAQVGMPDLQELRRHGAAMERLMEGGAMPPVPMLAF